MNNNLVKNDIVDDKSPLYACDLLHDAKFDLDKFTYNKEQGICHFYFEREFFEDKTLMKYEPKLFIFTKATFPLAESELILQNIDRIKIRDGSKIGIYTFNECRISKNKYLMNYCEDMDIEIIFKEYPKGKFLDNNLLNKQGTMWFFKNSFKNNKNWASKRGQVLGYKFLHCQFFGRLADRSIVQA
jgi:hypothetical protein